MPGGTCPVHGPFGEWLKTVTITRCPWCALEEEMSERQRDKDSRRKKIEASFRENAKKLEEMNGNFARLWKQLTPEEKEETIQQWVETALLGDLYALQFGESVGKTVDAVTESVLKPPHGESHNR